jgi:hypothetical protein
MASINRIGLALVFFTCLFARPAGAQAVRTWVSTSGSDSNPCSRSLPCRNFTAAIDAVNSGGEVVALDSGGFGPVTVTKAVSLIAPKGVHAAIAPTTGSAVTIDAGGTDRVGIENLYLNSQGATVGIDYNTAALLAVSDCTLAGFTRGIDFDVPANTNLSVRDSVFRGNNIGLAGQASAATARAVVNRATFDKNSSGIVLNGNTSVSVRDSTFLSHSIALRSASSNSGVADMIVDNCVINGANTGIFAGNTGPGTSLMTVSNTNVSGAQFEGIVAGSSSTIRVSNCVVTGNGTGVASVSGGSILTRQNNLIENNGTDGTFTGTMAAK